MIPWSIAKSAEAMFSRWAVKRVCKFLLKKKLGKFILGDIDLDQLDVQLSDGMLQLSDLALNVDYLNEKFGMSAPVIMKEGSIGSLLIKIPWNGRGCHVEVEEMEVVLAPKQECNTSGAHKTSTSSKNATRYPSGSEKLGHNLTENDARSISIEIHEGVKTIAKMVKCFLTSLHVKIRKLIIAFDPCMEMEKNKGIARSSLVLRMSEIECGTHVSEDPILNAGVAVENFLGISLLTNFLKFEGARVELLHLDKLENTTVNVPPSDNPLGESNATTLIMTGRGGSFSGILNLSIPWNHGSLDIRKVDADLSIDPIEIRFQPLTIKWFLLLWDTCNSITYSGTPASPPVMIHPDGTKNVYKSVSGSSSLCGFESNPETSLPGLNFIHDWVPSSVTDYQSEDVLEGVDFGASVDQFFECFDGMRSFQSAFGSSGMWNWTSSVFAAITAASSLASGSLHVPSEQQHLQTNFKASIAGISWLLFFLDEPDQLNGCMNVDYLGADIRDLSVAVQVCPWEMRLEGKMKNVEVAEYMLYGSNYRGPDGLSPNVDYQNTWIRSMQNNVLSTLPLFTESSVEGEAENHDGPPSDGFLTQSKDRTLKKVLLKANGLTQCLLSVNSKSSDRISAGVTSLSLILPPVIFWLNFDLIDKLVKFLMALTDCVEKSTKIRSNGDDKSAHVPCSTTFRGKILISSARVIFCFPLGNENQTAFNPQWKDFIVFDLSSFPFVKEKMLDEAGRYAGEIHFPSASRSLQFFIGDIDIYLVSPDSMDDVDVNNSGSIERFSSCKVASASSDAHNLSVLSLIWQECSSGPLIMEKIKKLVMLEESRWPNQASEHHEFAGVTSAKDLEGVYFQTKRDIVLSSAFCLHIKMVPVTVHLESSQYCKLHELFKQARGLMLHMTCNDTDGEEGCSASQTSILMECDYVEISIRPNIQANIQSSLQSELPGSWQQLTLGVHNFSLLAGSNIGDHKGGNLVWVAHHEGKVWGSTTSCQDQMLLISCSNSARKRGNGGGSNAISSRAAGLDVMHFQDPEKCHKYFSISVRCATVVAVGGRLDWVDNAHSFFILPLSLIEEDNDISFHKEEPTASFGSSFFLNLVDIGLSYEPHLAGFLRADSDSTSCYFKGDTWIACILAATSFKISSTSLAGSTNSDYMIRVQDLGLLLSWASKDERPNGVYSVENLRELDYVKIAQEAFLEAILRTKCKNGLDWEVECSNSHYLYVETCNDTTFGLIRLATQLQQLLAPDVEESAVQLQTRWNNVQKAQEADCFNAENGIFDPQSLVADMRNFKAESVDERLVAGLMDEIGEDAFPIDENAIIESVSERQVSGLMDEIRENVFLTDRNTSRESLSSVEFQPEILFGGKLQSDLHGLTFDVLDKSSLDQSLHALGSATTSDNDQTSFLDDGCFPELMENFYPSDLHPKSTVQLVSETWGSLTPGDSEIRRSNGWYDGKSIRILEDHISETSESGRNQNIDAKSLESDFLKIYNFGNSVGRLILKSLNVRWRIYSGSDWQVSRKDSTRNSSRRDAAFCLEVELSELGCQYDVYPGSGLCASRLSVSVKDFYIYDRSKGAPWKLVLSYCDSKDHPRDHSAKAFKLDLEAVRPDPDIPLEEYRLHVGILPLLVHLHQIQLDFLIRFFGMEMSDLPHYDLEDPNSSSSSTKTDYIPGQNSVGEALLPYFQKLDVWPVTVRVDYSPHHVDLTALRGGKYAELVNLTPWKAVVLHLKHVHATGVYGWGKVCDRILSEWLEDVSQNQIHNVLRGIPTLRSLFTLAHAGSKLISSPVKSYRKDRKLLKGVQRGTISFFRCLSLEAVALGVHLAAGTHDLVLKAECILNVPSKSLPQNKAKSKVKHNQPKNAKQGLQKAYESISDGLGRSASALIRSPLKDYQRGASAGSALATVVRGVPTAALAPASACVSAVHCTLLGFRNSLDPERRKESMDKYLGPDQLHHS